MIVDASIALKWSLVEGDSAHARLLLSRADLAAPTTIALEIGYTLTKLVRQRTITVDIAHIAWEQLDLYPMSIMADANWLRLAFQLSLRLTASFYDCVYLAMAIERDDILVTADQRFIRAVRSAADLAHRVRSLAEVVA